MAAEETPQYQIDDPEELSQTKRINELLARRKAVIDARDEAFDVQLLGEATEQEALAYYRSRLESLIVDLWTKFDGEDFELGQEYLETKDIDTIWVPPPDDVQPGGDADLAPGVDVPDPKPVHVQGLRWFIDHDQTVSVEFTVASWDPPGKQTVTTEVMVPETTLTKGLTACIEFMDETGIDADLNEQEQQTKIDRELLEEVDEWRKQNIDK